MSKTRAPSVRSSPPVRPSSTDGRPKHARSSDDDIARRAYELYEQRASLMTSGEPALSSPESLMTRIRGEYSEMPGLRLTFAQACRLWHLDRAACHAVLNTLLAEEFLTQAGDGTFVAVPQRVGRRNPLKATLAP